MTGGHIKNKGARSQIYKRAQILTWILVTNKTVEVHTYRRQPSGASANLLCPSYRHFAGQSLGRKCAAASKTCNRDNCVCMCGSTHGGLFDSHSRAHHCKQDEQTKTHSPFPSQTHTHTHTLSHTHTHTHKHTHPLRRHKHCCAHCLTFSDLCTRDLYRIRHRGSSEMKSG